MELSMKLQKAGPEHCKHLRMIMVWADITTSLTVWKQFDTYRAGIEKISTSTMHTLMRRELTADDFANTNDNFANAKVVSGESGRVGGSNVAATKESGLYVVAPTGTYDVDAPSSVWYSWTASFTGTVCFRALE